MRVEKKLNVLLIVVKSFRDNEKCSIVGFRIVKNVNILDDVDAAFSIVLIFEAKHHRVEFLSSFFMLLCVGCTNHDK